MKVVFRIFVVICLLSVMTIAGEVNYLPYKASLAAVSDPVVSFPFSEKTLANCGPGNFLFMEIEAVGTLTHLGLTYDRQHHCVNLETGAFFGGSALLQAQMEIRCLASTKARWR